MFNLIEEVLCLFYVLFMPFFRAGFMVPVKSYSKYTMYFSIITIICLFPSAGVSSRRRSRSVWARPASDSLRLRLCVCESRQPVRAGCGFTSWFELLYVSDWFVMNPNHDFTCRMCEFVDHLHEHFTSPVVIQDAHYMPPKVRPRAGTEYNYTHFA